MIRVVNKKSGSSGEYIGRPSALGNAFVIGKDGDRDTVIAKFEKWLDTKLAQKDERVRAEMNRLYKLAQSGDLDLVCWCAPARCHGDVIKARLEAALKERA